jgi:GcrA cell cycle regulator
MARDEFDWTDARVKRALKLRDEGLSARDMGEALGVSRNAVIGKFHRLKLAGQEGSK